MEAIANYSHLFRSEGLLLTFPDMDRMEDDFLEQTRGREIDLFVCTDSDAILGIGDQGVEVSPFPLLTTSTFDHLFMACRELE